MADIVSNMTGTVFKVLVNVGDSVSVDQDVLILESMKMEMMVPSLISGKVKEIKVKIDDFVQEGQVLIVLE
ncbi:MAG: acetyl-CoA carboxylase biotin carboxyl carrier protein subunit [Proteobacteria bacterium]|nr:acetyl-CoA carboxylase biotin carboxyl carrier protein subunit [Pseudomonadota bacterium]